jgi:hypothetical protein
MCHVSLKTIFKLHELPFYFVPCEEEMSTVFCEQDLTEIEQSFGTRSKLACKLPRTCAISWQCQ